MNRSEGKYGFPDTEEDEDLGEVLSFRLKSHPVLCRDALSFQVWSRLGKVCAVAGNERGEEAALLLGEHSPCQPWA